MKRFILQLIILIVSFANSYCQQDSIKREHHDDIMTLLGDIRHYGVYAAFTVKYSEINKVYNWDIGGRMGFVKNHSMSFGIAGYGFMKEPKFDIDQQADYALQGGYGGFFIERALFPKFPVHLSLPVFFGAGGVSYTKVNSGRNNYYWNNYTDNMTLDTQPFIIIEPGVELEMNLVSHLRVGFGAYYRLTSNIDVRNNSPEALNGFSVGMTFKFGKF
jgi:hypothetical protein